MTNDNKFDYISLLVDWKALRGAEEQLNAMKDGIREFISLDQLAQSFDPSELEFVSDLSERTDEVRFLWLL